MIETIEENFEVSQRCLKKEIQDLKNECFKHKTSVNIGK